MQRRTVSPLFRVSNRAFLRMGLVLPLAALLCGCNHNDSPPLAHEPPPTVDQALAKLPPNATPEEKAKVEAQIKFAQSMYDKMHPAKQ